MESNISLKREYLRDMLDELLPLTYDHHKEVDLYADKVKYDPDPDRFQELEDANLLYTYVLRVDGEIAGYWMFFLQPHLHYKSTMYAINNLVYIKPEHRGKNTPAYFYTVEQLLLDAGAEVIVYAMKEDKPFHRLMTGLGYDHAEHLYSKCCKE